MTSADRLRLISLFESLADEEVAAIARLCSIRSFQRDEQILGEHECTTDVFFILDGTVRVTSFSAAGKEVIFSDVAVGGFFGEFSALDRLPRSATVIALSNCLLARMPATKFYNMLHTHNGIAIHLAELLVSKIRSMSERVFEVSALAVRERIRRELLRLGTLHGSAQAKNIAINPAPTHYEFASRIGSHREAVTREFIRLEAQRIIQVSRRRIVICDIDLLRSGDPN